MTPMSSARSLIFRSLPLVFSVLLHTILVNAYEPIPPDVNSCNPALGKDLNRFRCEVAASDIPQDTRLRTFSTKKPTENDDWIDLPRTFDDFEGSPTCVITVELEGHSQRDNLLFGASWDTIRRIALNVITNCVNSHGWGGYVGLFRALSTLLRLFPESLSLRHL